MNISGWGNFPVIEGEVIQAYNEEIVRKIVKSRSPLIAFGNGRSYGDSALSRYVIDTKPLSYFLDFDSEQGILHCQSGVLLSDILETFVPRGWFLKVTPGTKWITVGGAIASDVHGKNHHKEGCFSSSVLEFRLMLPDGSIITCKPGDELFKATCGGMGLTGIIMDAKIKLQKIPSTFIEQRMVITKNLKETFDAFENLHNYTNSVAWIDCLAKGKNLGRSVIMAGEFSHNAELLYQTKKQLTVPFYFPDIVLNKWSVKTFNFLYYNKSKISGDTSCVDIEQFFYPLDSINYWNKMYGKNGFTQYQFILPLEKSFDGLSEILDRIQKSGKGSFLAVLKLYGDENRNYLSFPLNGYSLALDFKIETGLFDLLDELDKLVIKYGGRIYLTKDVRVKRDIFEKGYPLLSEFLEIRGKYDLKNKFESLQSKRLGI